MHCGVADYGSVEGGPRNAAGHTGLVVDSFVIEILEQDRRPRRVTITTTVEMGRECNGILLNDDQVSRRHAAFTPGPAGVTLTDLGSTNGTLLNGRRVTHPEIVGPGDEVRLGDTTVRILERQGAPEPSPTAPAPNVTALLVAPTLGAVAVLVRALDPATLSAHLGQPAATQLLEWGLTTLRHYATHAGGTAGAGSLHDGVTAAFPAAAAAADCALALLDAIAGRNAAGPPPPLVLACAADAAPAAQQWSGSAAAVASPSAPAALVVSAGVARALSGRGDLALRPLTPGPGSERGPHIVSRR